MKRVRSFLFILWVIATSNSFAQFRVQIPISGEWEFHKGPVEINKPDNSGWDKITVPHTWNAVDGTNKDYYRGSAVYSKKLFFPSSLKGKRLFIRFEAVSSVADVYLNGHYLGEHRGAFTAFCYEITKIAKIGENELIVKASNAWDKNLPPLKGDFTMFGGIYRPVWFIALNPICITPLDYASSGVFLKQTKVTDRLALIDVATRISNGTSKDQKIGVKVTLFNKENKAVASSQKVLKIGKNKTTDAVQRISITHPILWNGLSNPYLYRAFFQVTQNGRTVDTLSQWIGLRYYKVDSAKGFFLNGQAYKIHGVNRHQDRPGEGWAISYADQDQDMKLIKEIGANGIRGAHYPNSNYLYCLCDKIGFLVCAEIPLVNSITASPQFDENARQQLIELIRQNYNHPSIVFWSLFNELGQEKTDDPQPIITNLNDLAHQEDPTRLTVAAVNHPERPEKRIPDVIAFNVYPGWYVGSPNDMGKMLEDRNELMNFKGFGISEYGAGASIYQHQQGMTKGPKPKGSWHPEEWQAIVHEIDYKYIKESKFVWGSFIWNMFDFASAGRNEGDTPGINDKGLVTYDRKVKKDAFYFYKANWSFEPVVYITSRRDSIRNNADTEIKVYSNCSQLNLTVNGKDMGPVVGDNCVYVWKNIKLSAGKNIISAKVFRDGKEINDQCEWHYIPKSK